MRYEDDNLIDALAREYVLGTLHGRARARFDRLRRSSLPIARAVIAWEQRLAPLNAAVQPLQPADAVWPRIEAALELGGSQRALGRWWRAAAAGFALLAVLFGALYLGQSERLEQASYVSVITDEQAMVVWLLQGFSEAERLRIDAINDIAPPPGSAYELWMLPNDGTAPVSLGLIAGSGRTQLPLTQETLAVLNRSSTLAVSLEPAGGSPTGAPTGPVLYTGALLSV